MPQRKVTRFFPALFVLLWSTGFVGAGLAMPHAEPFTFLSLRYAVAIAIMLALVASARLPRPSPADVGTSMIVGLLVHGVYLGGVFWAVHNGLPAGLSALIVGLQPVLTALLAAALLREPVRLAQWIGLAAGFAGIILVLAPKLGALGNGVTAANVFAAFLSAAAISAGTVLQKARATALDIRMATLFQFVGAFLVTGILSFGLETQQIDWTGELVFALLWLVFVLSIGAIFLLMRLIREGEVSKVSSLFYLVPGVTALMTWALFGETLTPVQIAGMVLTMAGVAIASRRQGVRPDSPAA